MTDFGPFLEIPSPGDGAPIAAVLKRLETVGRTDVIGARGGALAALLARAPATTGTVVVAEDASRAAALHADLCHHMGVGPACEDVILYPSEDMGPYDEMIPDRRSILRRSSVLFKLSTSAGWRFMVIAAAALLRRILPRSSFEDACVPVAVGDRLDRDLLVETLERGGFSRAPLVEERGTYALRGGVVDRFVPYMDAPARMELFGSEVERIRWFDPETQLGGDTVGEVWIHPARLVAGRIGEEVRERAAREIRAICDEVEQPTARTERLMEDLFEGRLFVGAQGFEPAFHEDLGSIFEYLPRDVSFCVDNPSNIRQVWLKEARAQADEYRRRIERGHPAFEPERHMLDPGPVEEIIASKRLLAAHRLLVGDPGGPLEEVIEPIDLAAASTAETGQRLRRLTPAGKSADLLGPLADHLSGMISSGYRVAAVAHTKGQADRLAAMLGGRGVETEELVGPLEERVPGVYVEQGELVDGCVLPGDGIAWITEEEIFGHRSRRLRGTKRRSGSMDDLRSLTPGDLVVHSDHGVGRYEGLHSQRVRNALVDFLHIVYRDGDKLLLPVYRLSQVQKYRSVAQGEIRLDKLGGQTFAKTKALAKKHAMEVAAKLLDLYARREVAQRPPTGPPDQLYWEFEAGFPFEETDDQARAIDEVMTDLGAKKPMDRLVCGDVGYGKTEVAMRAAFRIVMSGRQVAVLVPTTVLAQQHYQSFNRRFADYPIRVEMMSRFRTPAQNGVIAAGLKDGTVDVVVGTHRLLSRDVHFKRLGLLVIDEEHRFGVTHKERIRSLRASVDTMVLTATPIPRTLHMAFSGLRDLSLIGTAPVDRRPIRTVACHDDPEILKKAMERELSRDGQVFFVHNRVRGIGRVAERVRRMMPEARVAVGHGQMKEEELERVMLDFVEGRYDILVCTAIIESGLDIPRANTIIIDRADTFGLAQLYQLRGRVGRSHVQAYAYLVVPPMNALSDDARERVEALRRYTDLGSGFSVATLDLEIRGAGNLLGAEQSGDVAGVGFEMYCELLEEASSKLKGVEHDAEVEPEMTFEDPGQLPEEYIPDVGLRLQYYKQLASAGDEVEVERMVARMVDRFGPLPAESERLARGMVAKSICRQLRIAGLETGTGRIVVHLGHDSMVDPDTVMEIVRQEEGAVRLTPDLKLIFRPRGDGEADTDAAIRFLRRLGACEIKTA